MHIGLVGAGQIGSTAARLFLRAGHEVTLSNSRGPVSLSEQVAQLGTGASAMPVADTAMASDIALIAIPFGQFTSLPAAAFRDKIVIDAMNYYPQRDGYYPVLDLEQATSSELLADHLRGARVVKAFNTIYYEHLGGQGNLDLPVEARRAIFISGDDIEAKQIISKLIEQIGFGAVDMGSLSEGGRQQQPGTPVYNRNLTVLEGIEIRNSYLT